MSTDLVMNLNLSAGQQLKVKGFVPSHAKRFWVNLGSDASNLALHFNPRYDDEIDGAVIVCNSLTNGSWGMEHRQNPNPIQRGADVTIAINWSEGGFKVELPHGHEVQFPNRPQMNDIKYIDISGDFKLTSLDIC